MSQSIQNILERNGINMDNRFVAIERVGIMSFSPAKCRNLIEAILDIPSAAIIGDDEAEKTLQYLIDQYFDLSDLKLEEAHKRALYLIKKHPHILIKSRQNENIEGVDITINDDGVKVGKTGKPRKGYKKEMALQLWRDYNDSINERKDWIALFIDEISGMTKSVATTYIHNIESGKWIT